MNRVFRVLSEKFESQFRSGLNVAAIVIDIVLCDDAVSCNMLLSMLNAERTAGAI